jgi:hypothetical protein
MIESFQAKESMPFSGHCQEIFTRPPVDTFYYVISISFEEATGFSTRPLLEKAF